MNRMKPGTQARRVRPCPEVAGCAFVGYRIAESYSIFLAGDIVQRACVCQIPSRSSMQGHFYLWATMDFWAVMRNVIYFEMTVITALLGITAIVLKLKGPDMATMTNTFAGISGVLLGLYFVIRSDESKRDPTVTQLLLASILVSMVSSLFSYNDTYPVQSQLLFTISAIVFEGSITYFAIGTELLGPLVRKKRMKES